MRDTGLMAWVTEAISEIVETGIAPVLKASNYRRKRRHWMLQLEHVTRTVNVQSSRYNSTDSGKFTINLGLAHHELSGRPEGFVTYLDIGRSPGRIGVVMPIGRDYWWEIAKGDDLGAVAVSVEDALVQYALPWLERCSDPMEIIDDLFERDTIVPGSYEIARRLDIDIAERSRRSLERWLSYPMARLGKDNSTLEWVDRHLTLSDDSGRSLTQAQLTMIQTLLDTDWSASAGIAPGVEEFYKTRLRTALEQRLSHQG